MNKVFKIRNNNKPIGKCNVFLDHFKKVIVGEKSFYPISITGKKVYYEVKSGDTLLGIVSSYLSDPEHIEKVINTIKKENGIKEVKAGDIIVLHDIKDESCRDSLLSSIVEEIEDRFKFVLDYIYTANDINSIKNAVVVSFIGNFIKDGIYRNRYNLDKCLEKCRELSDNLIMEQQESIVKNNNR